MAGRKKYTGSKDFGVRLGLAIRARRKAKDMTLQEVSDTTSGVISVSLIASYEKGTVPSIDRYLILCSALGCSFEELLPDGTAPKV